MNNAKMMECADEAGIIRPDAYRAARNEIDARRAEVAAAFREHPELKKEFFSAICKENRAKAKPENMKRSAESHQKAKDTRLFRSAKSYQRDGVKKSV